MDAPTKKLIMRKIRLPDELTAAKALSPRYRLTIQASAVLYSCWKSWLRNTGAAKVRITFRGSPSVINTADRLS